jgi:hypothetical protein
MHRLLPPIFLLLACLVSLRAAPQPSMWRALSSQQQGELTLGNPVVIEEAIAGNPWPRYTVYQVVKSSSAEAAAVFWDCELDPKYVPNCLSVRSVAHPSPWIFEGEYTLKMPLMMPNEIYNSRNELKAQEVPEVYEISWNVQKARYIKASMGNIRIEPLGLDECTAARKGDQALIRYTNLVVPGSSIAGLLQPMACSEVVESVKALANQIENEINASPQLLKKQMEKLTQALKAIPKGQKN